MIRDYTSEELCAKIDEIGAFDYIQFITVPTNEYETPINSIVNTYDITQAVFDLLDILQQEQHNSIILEIDFEMDSDHNTGLLIYLDELDDDDVENFDQEVLKHLLMNIRKTED